MSELESKAMAFATRHHEAIYHRRKYTDEPYIVHPMAVAELVRGVPHTEAMLAAAWCHDTVEDTGVTLEMVAAELGPDVASLVEMLTDISRLADGNRAIRKTIDLAHTAKASPGAKTIKLADLIDNSASIVARDPIFARLYIEEKARLLDVLRDGDASLHAIATEIVVAARARRST